MFEAIIGDYAYLPGPLCLIKEARSALLCAPRALFSRGLSEERTPFLPSCASRAHLAGITNIIFVDGHEGDRWECIDRKLTAL